VIFTPKPQPIVRLLNVKANKIECGKDHVMFLTADRELYSWGSNEYGQIGINKKHSAKIVQFYSYQREDIVDGKTPKA